MTHTASKPTILIVDDDPNNIEILELDLEDEHYNILTASDGVEGWEILQKHKEDIHVVLLDRMMPNMDGMAFMEKYKADESVAGIPVIMQTAAAEREQISEGIQAGVYYYLTKPYEQEIMLAVIRSALQDYEKNLSLRNELQQFIAKLKLVKESYFEVITLEDANYLATFLANFFPDPNRVARGILELLINAVEHGNLGISYNDKTTLLMENNWETEIERRLALPENVSKKVTIHFKRAPGDIQLTITDEGEGFEWQKYLEFDMERAAHIHGRGIAMSKMMNFDELHYNDRGNEVTAIVYTTPPCADRS